MLMLMWMCVSPTGNRDHSSRRMLPFLYVLLPWLFHTCTLMWPDHTLLSLWLHTHIMPIRAFNNQYVLVIRQNNAWRDVSYNGPCRNDHQILRLRCASSFILQFVFALGLTPKNTMRNCFSVGINISSVALRAQSTEIRHNKSKWETFPLTWRHKKTSTSLRGKHLFLCVV